MLYNLLKMDNLIFYILAAEAFFLLLAQLRTNELLKKSHKIRALKREHAKQLKEEVKRGTSSIPVVKFEKEKGEQAASKKEEKSGSMDQKEMAVLQEMIQEFFG